LLITYSTMAQTVHRKNNFTEISENLGTDLKKISLDHQNNYVTQA